jgi:LPS-assembly protein
MVKPTYPDLSSPAAILRNLPAAAIAIYVMTAAATPAAQTVSGSQRWSLCPITVDIPPRPPVTEVLAPGDIYATADEAVYTEGGVAYLSGDAEIVHDQQQLTADRITYNQALDTVDLEGEVNYWDDRVYLSGPSAHVNLADDMGSFNEVRYWLLDNRGRGNANRVLVYEGERTEGTRVDYTTCDPDLDGPWNLTTNIWKLSASELALNHETERGTGKHVILKIKDIPVFYVPWLSFPISDDRKSGLLVPSFGSSSRYGFEFQAPYYWNIAPQMDATITPRLISNSGVMVMGQYRYLLERGAGVLQLEYLPSDKVSEDKDRNSISFQHKQSFLNNGYLSLLYDRVSDQNYLEDFSSSLMGTSTQFLEQSATVTYGWNIAGHSLGLYNVVGNFQTVDRSLPVSSRPYKRLPTTILTFSSPYRDRRLNYSLTGRFDYFTRGDDPLLNSVNGMRYDLFPSVSVPLQDIAYFLTPKAGVRFTRYQLEDNTTFSDNGPDRLLPFFSLDGGLFLERDTSIFDHEVIQTLEPRLYYLFVPEERQADLPVFDTGIFGTSFSSLFYEERFNGPDRFGDANQLTYAVTSRLYGADSGQQLGYVSIGQIVYFRDRTVVLPDRPVQDDTFSAVVSEFGTTLFNHVDVRGEFQWDPDAGSAQKLGFSAQYHPGFGKVVNLGYRVHKSDPDLGLDERLRVEQTDMSFRWPVQPEWSVVGRWNYALDEERSLDLFAGIEYNSCCWSVRAVARRFLSNLDGEFETGLFLQIELKGLAGIGEKTVDFLTLSIPGYESEF